MSKITDYYRVLGVSPDSEDVVIQAAYRALMRRYHPDTNKSPTAMERAQQINQAYATLGDPQRRANYDRQRRAERPRAKEEKRQTDQAKKPTPPPPQPAREMRPTQIHTSKSHPLVWAGSFTGLVLVVAILSALKPSAGGANTDFSDNYEAAADNLEMQADVLAFDVANNASENAVVSVPTLADVEMTAVEFTEIEKGANRFARTLIKSGMAGARSFSDQCHKNVEAEPTWSKADYCAAFDFAAAHVDSAIARASGWSPNSYFAFQRDNQADRYTSAGAPAYLVHSRLLTIKRTAEAEAESAIQSEIAKSEASKSKATPPSDAVQPPPLALPAENSVEDGRLD